MSDEYIILGLLLVATIETLCISALIYGVVKIKKIWVFWRCYIVNDSGLKLEMDNALGISDDKN